MLTLSAFRWQAVRTRVGTRRTRWTYGSAPVCKLQVGRGLFVAPETTCDSRSARKFLKNKKFRADLVFPPRPYREIQGGPGFILIFKLSRYLAESAAGEPRDAALYYGPHPARFDS